MTRCWLPKAPLPSWREFGLRFRISTHLSGALGNAVNHTLERLIPVLVSAPADLKTRATWLERVFVAI